MEFVHLVTTSTITQGHAKFTYKGTLENPYKSSTEPDKETIRGTSIKNGETFKIIKGDIISIPPNTPHSVDAKDTEISFMTIKIDNVV